MVTLASPATMLKLAKPGNYGTFVFYEMKLNISLFEEKLKLKLNKWMVWEVTLVNACGGRNVATLRDSSTLRCNAGFTQLQQI